MILQAKPRNCRPLANVIVRIVNTETGVASVKLTGGSERTASAVSINRVLWVLALIPLAEILMFFSLVLRVRIGEGHWPSYGNPDPKELGFHHTLTWILLLGAFAAVITVPVAALTARLSGYRQVQWAPVLFVVASFTVTLVFFRSDVAGLTDWFAD